MADPQDVLEQPSDSEDTSEESPVEQNSPDLEALIRSVLGSTLKSEFDLRFSGLQSSQDKRFAALAKELKSSSLTEEEQEDYLEREQAQETAKALQIAELIKRRKTTPEAVDFLLESMDKPDLDEQLSFIQSVLGSKAAGQIAAAVASATTPDKGDGAAPTDNPIPDSDKNNPVSQRSNAPEGDMDMELADAVLDQVGRGQISRFFRRE